MSSTKEQPYQDIITYCLPIHPDDYMLQAIFQYLLGNDAHHIVKENSYLSLVNRQFYRNVRAYVQSKSTQLRLDVTLYNKDCNDGLGNILFLSRICFKLCAMGATIHTLHISFCYKQRRNLYLMLHNLHLVHLNHLSIEAYTCGDYILSSPYTEIYSLFARCDQLQSLHICDDSGRNVCDSIFTDKPHLASVKLAGIGIGQTFPIPIIESLPSLKRLELNDNVMHDEQNHSLLFTTFSSTSLMVLNLTNCLMEGSNITLNCPSLKLFLAYSNDFPSLVHSLDEIVTVNDEEVKNLIIAEDILMKNEHISSRGIYCMSQDKLNNISWANFSPNCHFILYHFDEEAED